MPRIVGVTTASPKNTLDQATIKSFARQVFGSERDVDRLLPVFDNANIDKRHFVADMDWFGTEHSFTDVNDLYINAAVDLTEQAVLALAEQCSISTTDFDVIFFVSTTGLSTPSIDARLFNRIPLNRHIKRVPIWGLGCAGGAGGVARAFDYLKAYPSHRALVVTVELCGLAFQRNDTSKSNIIATALFGDGASAALIIGDDVSDIPNGLRHPRIVGSLSTIYPDSLDVMGWQVGADGFKVVLSRDIPSIVTGLVRENVEELTSAHEITIPDITQYVAHPGGTKVLEAYCEALGIGDTELRHSRDVLREFGNMSSTTVFFILERFMGDKNLEQGAYGLMTALGPGFSSELVLLQWD